MSFPVHKKLYTVSILIYILKDCSRLQVGDIMTPDFRFSGLQISLHIVSPPPMHQIIWINVPTGPVHGVAANVDA